MGKPAGGGIYGYATIHPQDDVACGTYGTWTITFTVGKHGIDNGGAMAWSSPLYVHYRLPDS